MDYLVGLSGCAFIVGLALHPTRLEALRGAPRAPSLALYALSALSLIGAALCT